MTMITRQDRRRSQRRGNVNTLFCPVSKKKKMDRKKKITKEKKKNFGVAKRKKKGVGGNARQASECYFDMNIGGSFHLDLN